MLEEEDLEKYTYEALFVQILEEQVIVTSGKQYYMTTVTPTMIKDLVWKTMNKQFEWPRSLKVLKLYHQWPMMKS